MNPLVMPRAECEAMLSEVRIGILSVNGGPDRPPLLGPLWYAYEPGGEVQMNIGTRSHKARAVLAGEDMATLRLTPERWLSNDYGRLET